ncbi:hypothetical protein ALQ72_03597 [Pseudomonas syringae pv. maculicola]|uniref:hypothetical protein n=1 Tax=Pseudomonas syringae group genomosp. 3 TaxID=251701 RepID=UPI0006B9D79C|nr:hypothetical protein [Pseudomonas syringae group genomosp. 3]MBM0209654.1 hypothetical protein [Pseudomonas syringae pv. maculicola]RMM81814.1 hypothetical protein ALQ72_03597 [Pseudomonas syringae pv. maculicola]
MATEKQEYTEVFTRLLQPKVWEKRAHTIFAGFNNRLPVFGQYLRIGPGLAPLAIQIGYVVQIRRCQGRFGSDIYLLRHCTGELVEHSNNSYLPLTPEEIDAVLPCFGDVTPSAEGHNPVYGLCTPGSRSAGFVIEPPAGFEARGGEGTRMKVIAEDAEGTKSLTDIVFL